MFSTSTSPAAGGGTEGEQPIVVSKRGACQCGRTKQSCNQHDVGVDCRRLGAVVDGNRAFERREGALHLAHVLLATPVQSRRYSKHEQRDRRERRHRQQKADIAPALLCRDTEFVECQPLD